MTGWIAIWLLGSRGSRSKKGEGESLLFPPVHLSADGAKEALLHLVRRDPRQLGEPVTRWKLSSLLQHCQRWGWQLSTRSGVWQLLRNLAIHYKRGRSHVHSPDPYYQAKVDQITSVEKRTQASEGSQVLLYLDEVTYYRQPSIGYAYEEAGEDRPYAEQSLRTNSTTRVIAALDRSNGQVHFLQASKIGINQLVAFYQQLVQAYPQAERIWVVQDNWPVHFHPDVLVALEAQQSPFPLKPIARNWPEQPSQKAVKKWAPLNLPLQIVVLPSYASWLNPIEKLWRKLKQEVLHRHRWADDLAHLRQEVASFLSQFNRGSVQLLREVGLRIPY